MSRPFADDRVGALGTLVFLAALASGCGGGGGGGGGGTGTGSGTGTDSDTSSDTETSTKTDTSTATDTGKAPEAFEMTEPVHDSSSQPLTPTLKWAASTHATKYKVEISTKATFDAASDVDVEVESTQYEVPSSAALTPGVIYYWRVTAKSAGGTKVASKAPRRFSSPYEVASARGIAVTPDGAKLVVASGVNDGTVDIITLASHSVTSQISTTVASQPQGVAVSSDGTQALVTLNTNGPGGINGVSMIDLTNDTLLGNVTAPCVATTLTDVAFIGTGSAAAMPDLSPSCTSMGLTTFTANVGTPGFSYVPFNTSNNPWSVAATPDGATAVVTMQLSTSLRKVTLPSTVSLIDLGANSYAAAVTHDGTTAVVTTDAGIALINLADDAVTQVAFTPDDDGPNGDYRGVAITPDDSKAVIVGASHLNVISLESHESLASYPMTGGGSVAVSTDGKLAFVTDTENGWVRVVALP